MANEFKTTTTTAAGVMEREQANLTAGFLMGSRLFEAVKKVEAINASSVQFYSIPLPSGVTAQSEADDWTTSAVTFTAKAVTPVSYQKTTKVSDLTLQGGAVAVDALLESLAADVALGVDTAICAQFADFGPFVADTSCTATLFGSAVATARNSGYSGRLFAVLTERQAMDLGVSLGAMYNPRKNDEFISYGYIGNVMGAEVFTVPSSAVTTSGSYGVGAVYFENAGIGFGYHPNENGGMVKVKVVEAPGGAWYSAWVDGAATELTTSGGCEIRTLNY